MRRRAGSALEVGIRHDSGAKERCKVWRAALASVQGLS